MAFKLIVIKNNIDLLSLNKLHNKIGHANFRDIHRTSKHYHIVTEKAVDAKCEDCLIAK